LRSPKGPSIVAALAIFFIAPAWGACPDGTDCVWVDSGVCGVCVSDSSDCGVSQDCPTGPCVGEGPTGIGGCSIGGAACNGDADCQPTHGVCIGYCNGDGVNGCAGDGQCQKCTDGTVGAGTPLDPFCRISQAYQAASDGDTIYVGPGEYKQCADLRAGALAPAQDRTVHLLARAFDESSENKNTIAATVINGDGVCTDIPCVTLFGDGATMKGFTVTGGTTSGVFVAGSVAITSNRITGNSSVIGGGIYAYAASCYYDGISTISITDNEITDNRAIAGPANTIDVSFGHGGGIGVVSLERPDEGCNGNVNIEIRDNLVERNTIENSNVDGNGDRYTAKGGGIYVRTAMEPGGTSNITIEGNVVAENQRSSASLASAGGGIFVVTELAGFGQESIVVRDNTIGPNNLAHEGGGIAAWASTRRAGQHSILIEKNEIMNNRATSTEPEGAGGGVSLRVEALDLGPGDSVALDFRQNEVFGNFADSSDGGGVRASLLSERSVDLPSDGNPNPADEMSMRIEDNTIRNNTSRVGGAGVLLLVLADSDPGAISGPCDPLTQLRASGTIEFNRNLVTGNRAINLTGFDEVGAGILTIPTTIGEAEATILINGSTLAGNTIDTDFESAGGLETLPFADPDCDGTLDASITVSLDRSIVDGNDGYGAGGTPLGLSAPPGTLVTPVTNSYVFGNELGGFMFALYPSVHPSNSLTDPLLNGDFAPAACSTVFNVRVCEGTTDICIDNSFCDPGIECLRGVGFHGNPDVAPDFLIDGLDVLDLAISFDSTDVPDPRFSERADLDHNGIVDGEDLRYMGSQFGQVCRP